MSLNFLVKGSLFPEVELENRAFDQGAFSVIILLCHWHCSEASLLPAKFPLVKPWFMNQYQIITFFAKRLAEFSQDYLIWSTLGIVHDCHGAIKVHSWYFAIQPGQRLHPFLKGFRPPKILG